VGGADVGTELVAVIAFGLPPECRQLALRNFQCHRDELLGEQMSQ
jgi:hypothetical protein